MTIRINRTNDDRRDVSVALQKPYAYTSVMKMRVILSFRYLHNIISDFDETSHTLNRNILFIRDKTIRERNDSL